MNRLFQLRPLCLACAAASLTLPGLGHASGFAIPENSIVGLGASNALVANTDEVGAIAYNPAIAALQDSNSVSAGLMPAAPTHKVTTATGSHESQGRDIAFIPMGQLAYHWNEQATLTLGIFAPSGLETVWNASTPDFPGFAGGHPTKSKVELLDVTPSLAFKLNDRFAAAVGADLYWARSVVFDADVVWNNGDGTGWGWNASLVYDDGPWALGLAYRSAATVDVQGTSTFPLLSLSTAAQADLPVPSRLQAGMRYRASKAFSVEFDITRTGWSDFDTLVINNAISTVTSTNNWKDSNAYRLSATYQLDGKTRLRCGYTYDETPQPRSYFSPRIPDNNRHLFSIGMSHDLGDGLEIDAGYMYVKIDKYTQAATGAGPVAGDPNGSILYNGSYDSHVHLLGLGVSKRF